MTSQKELNVADFRIAVIGLGYVGLPLAVEIGKRMPVIGFDINSSRVNELAAGFDRTREVAEADLVKTKNLSFTATQKNLSQANFYIVTVPTPVDKAFRPDTSALQKASQMVGEVLEKGDIVVYESTVFPGATEEICVPILEEVSELKLNKEFFCGYSPERINPGDKVHTLTKVKKIVSGSCVEATNILKEFYEEIIEAGVHVAPTIKVAEAAKVIENTQRDINIALVNELSVIFDRLNIDTAEVLDACSSKWNFLPFRPGLVGGHCIGVDPYYLTHKAEEVGYHPQVILAGRRINDNMGRYVARNTIKLMVRNGLDPTKSKVGIMGITFKENCPDVRNSKVVDIVREFKDWGIEVSIVDPWVDETVLKEDYDIELSSEFSQSLDALVVAVGHTEYRSKTLVELKELFSGSAPILIDVKSLYDRKKAEELGFTVFRL